MTSAGISDPALRFWLDYIEAEGGLCDVNGDKALALPSESVRGSTGPVAGTHRRPARRGSSCSGEPRRVQAYGRDHRRDRHTELSQPPPTASATTL